MKLRPGGFRLQLFAIFVVPASLLVLTVAVVATGVHRRAMRGLVAQRDERAIAAAAAAIDEAALSRLSMLRLVAAGQGDQSVGDADLAGPELRRAFPQGVGLYDEQGVLLAGQDLLAEVAPLSYSELRAASKPVTVAMFDGEASALFAAPAEETTLVGAILLRTMIEPVTAGMIEVTPTASTYLIDSEGDLLLSFGANPSGTENLATRQELSGQRGSRFVGRSEGEVVVAYAPIPSAAWTLIIEEPWESVASSLLDLSLLAPFAMVPVLLLTVVAVWFGASRVIDPLRRLEGVAQELPAGDLAAIEEPIGGIEEIEQLRETLLRMVQRVREAQSALRAYIGVITDAQEDERRRLARELHDESIQHWIALDHRLQMATNRLRQQENPEAETLEELHHEAQTGIQGLRRLTRGLRPLYLEDLGLAPAVDMLASDARQSSGIPVHVEITGRERRLATEIELAAYRLVQEGLSNIGRHAEASSATIKVEFGERDLTVNVQDDGRGFSPPGRIEDLAASGHYGLMGMQERADAVGGRLNISSSPGSGTNIQFTVPIKQANSNR